MMAAESSPGRFTSIIFRATRFTYTVHLPVLNRYLGRIVYNKRCKFDPYFNEFVMMGFRDGKQCDVPLNCLSVLISDLLCYQVSRPC